MNTWNDSARLISVATATPPKRYSQQEILDLYGVTDTRVRSMFLNSHIEGRQLCLPERLPSGKMPEETPEDLNRKHLRTALAVGSEAISQALQGVGLQPPDVDYLLTVSSTGFLTPGLTAHFIKELGFREDVQRVDVVGMGCNGGLNGMQPVVNFCNQNPGAIGLLVCVEICSAAYVFDGTMRTSVVNCLFGDGAAAAVLTTSKDKWNRASPRILGFNSHIITSAIGAMRFDLEGAKFSFFLDKEIPYVLGENAHKPVDRLLTRHGLKRRDIHHWVVHSGGKKVIDAIKYALNISAHDVRHTVSVLRDFGNISSGSFLFSYNRLLDEQVAKAGDYMVMMTMGPGSTIETCLAHF